MSNRCLLYCLLLSACCLTSLHAQKKKKPSRATIEAERKQALAEADRQAFADNMKAYQQRVKPFLQKHCIRCHGPKKLEGDLSLDLLDADMKRSASASRWASVRERLTTGEMPPKDEPQPSAKEIEPVIAWIKAEMKRSRRNFTRRIQHVHGNHVPHSALFDDEQSAPLDVPPRIRRFSPEIYESFRREQAKGFENLVGNPFTPDPRFLFHDMGAPKMDVPTTSQLIRNALTIIRRQTGFTRENGKLKPARGARKEFLTYFDESKPFSQKDMAKMVAMQFLRTLGRSPTDDEQKRFVALMEKNVHDAGREVGIRYTLAAVYLLPSSIFRFEVGGEALDGRSRLKPTEIAQALAFALTDRRPPSWLIKWAEDGKLDDRNGVEAAVEQMFKDEKLRKPRLLRFFHEYFEYPRALEVFKNPEDFRSHKARVLVSDTDRLIQWILDRDKQVLRELLTTNRAFVNAKFDTKKKQNVPYEAKSTVHQSYSLPPDWKWTAEQPIELPANLRAGVLTQPSWLVAWSVNQDNHAILRGKWVRERLLGNVVPDIPITVDAQLPEAPEKTLRERMVVTREAYCWQCHKLMNPVGLPFETYDHFGRWRAVEKGRPVVATGKIDLTGDKDFEVEVDGAVDFMRQLAASKRVEQVFVRHVFRYFAGRNENLGDGKTLREAHAAYRKSDGSFEALVRSILASDSFLYRTPAKQTASVRPRVPDNQE